MRALVFGFCPLFLLLAAGCGPGVGDVSGVVTFQGKPLSHGDVRIMPGTGLSVNSKIAPDGTYLLKDVPVGSGKVIVTSVDGSMGDALKALAGKNFGQPNPTANPMIKGRDPVVIPRGGILQNASFSLIPEAYGDFDNSGLGVNVQRGKNTYDISLTGDAPKLFKLK